MSVIIMRSFDGLLESLSRVTLILMFSKIKMVSHANMVYFASLVASKRNAKYLQFPPLSCSKT